MSYPIKIMPYPEKNTFAWIHDSTSKNRDQTWLFVWHFCSFSMLHDSIPIFHMQSNRSSWQMALLKCHQFVYLIELYHHKNSRSDWTKLRNEPQTNRRKGVWGWAIFFYYTFGGVGIPKATIEKKINSIALLTTNI